MEEQDRDVWLVALILVNKMGADAVLYSESRADQALKDGNDIYAWCVWRSDWAAVRELLRAPEHGDTVN